MKSFDRSEFFSSPSILPRSLQAGQIQNSSFHIPYYSDPLECWVAATNWHLLVAQVIISSVFVAHPTSQFRTILRMTCMNDEMGKKVSKP